MILENRELIFPEKVLRYALLSQCLAEGIDVPNSKIQDIILIDPVTKHGSPKVHLEFMTADSKKPYVVPLSEQFVLTAMILVCQDLGVPLPRNGEKTLRLTESGLAMAISMQVKTPGM